MTVEPAAGGIDGGRRVAAAAESGCHGGQLDCGGHRRSTCRLPEPERDRGALDARRRPAAGIVPGALHREPLDAADITQCPAVAPGLLPVVRSAAGPLTADTVASAAQDQARGARRGVPP